MKDARTGVAAVWLGAGAVAPAAAGDWESYGVCSYLRTGGSLDKPALAAGPACHDVSGSGTGILQSTFTCDSGQVMTHVLDVQASMGIHSDTLNGRKLLEQVETDAGVCWVVKEEVGFSASCFRRIGERF